MSPILPHVPFVLLQAKDNAFSVAVGDGFEWKVLRDSKILLNAPCSHKHNDKTKKKQKKVSFNSQKEDTSPGMLQVNLAPCLFCTVFLI